MDWRVSCRDDRVRSGWRSSAPFLRVGLVEVLVNVLQPAAWAVTDDMQVRCDGQSQIDQVVTDNQVVKKVGEEKETTVPDIYTKILLARVRHE